MGTKQTAHPDSLIAEMEGRIGGDVLRLEIGWFRKGKPMDAEVMLFAVERGGRVLCMFCGESMRILQFKEHYFGCRDEAGEW